MHSNMFARQSRCLLILAKQIELFYSVWFNVLLFDFPLFSLGPFIVKALHVFASTVSYYVANFRAPYTGRTVVCFRFTAVKVVVKE